MKLTIPVAHDFICPWCWVGLLQALRLKEEFGVSFEWRGFELFPDELEWGNATPAPPPPANKPPTPTRFEFILIADGIELPKSIRPHKMRTHNAHEAVEYAKTEGDENPFVEALYRAYWEQGLEINDPKVLKKLAKPYIKDRDAMMAAIEKRKFKDNIVGFDDPSYALGVYNVPTFYIGNERYAEQPYQILKKALEAALDDTSWSHIYEALEFPKTPDDRPYTYINMVATIDGKILSGDRDESVVDLGSKVDHKLMKRIEASADAVMVGAQTLRTAAPSWNPKAAKRIVVTRSGNLPPEAAFFHQEAFIATTGAAKITPPDGARVLRTGEGELDFEQLFTKLKSLGVNRLLVMGGSELNAELLQNDLVDELFLTIAPKVKLGRDVPTYAGGNPLPRDQVQNFRLVEHHVFENELFLRYRRERKK